MSLIKCEVSLTLTWSENFALTDITPQTARAAQGDNPARLEINPLKRTSVRYSGDAYSFHCGMHAIVTMW